MLFGGRRAKTAPLVYQSRDWNHGVFMGATVASETTAAATGAVGVVRRDPMSMRPFIGYHVADYWQHWIDMGKSVPNLPKIFHVNWFRTDDEGHFLWPGFGENMRVVEWILKRCRGEVEAVETPIGFMPKPEDISLEGIENEVSEDTLKNLLSVDVEVWKKEADDIEAFFAQVGEGKLPAELAENLEILKKNLGE